MDIILKSDPLSIIKVKRKTTAKLFKDLKVGDSIMLSVPVKHAGSNRGITYSTYIKTINLANNEVTLNSFNQLPQLLDVFEFKNSEGGI
jgi:hypothetical protein